MNPLPVPLEVGVQLDPGRVDLRGLALMSASAPSTVMICQWPGSNTRVWKSRWICSSQPQIAVMLSFHGGFVQLEAVLAIREDGRPQADGGHAARSRGRSTSWPRSKRAPARTRATKWRAFTARERAWADSTSLKTMARPAVREPAPRVTLVRRRTVENVDSMGFVPGMKLRGCRCPCPVTALRSGAGWCVGPIRCGSSPGLRADDQVALEATGNASAVAVLLEPHVAKVVISNPVKLPGLVVPVADHEPPAVCPADRPTRLYRH